LDCIKQIKEVQRGRIKEYLNSHPNAQYFENTNGQVSPVWNIKTDIALPCATQNELTLDAAKILVSNGVIAVGEGANMPCTYEATQYLLENNILVGAAKAANAGGVATSAIEMSQNSMRYYYTFEEVEKKLEQIMIHIFNDCKTASDNYGLNNNYVAGANIAAFKKLADAMLAQGIV
jgi:glutamate dehydrogenase (NADP+)